MSLNQEDSTKIKIAKDIRSRLIELRGERYRALSENKELPPLQVPIDDLLGEHGFKGNGEQLFKMLGLEYRGLFRKNGDFLVPNLQEFSLDEFISELGEQISMQQGSFGKESVRRREGKRGFEGPRHDFGRRR